MEPLLLLKAAMLGVVEGLTEFLPISSTGHLIWASALLSTDPVKSPVFDIAIQTGAVLAILWNYRRRCCEVLVGFASSRRHRMFVATVVLAFLPAAVVGAVAGAFIKAALFKPVPVALALIAKLKNLNRAASPRLKRTSLPVLIEWRCRYLLKRA